MRTVEGRDKDLGPPAAPLYDEISLAEPASGQISVLAQFSWQN
jgi:hypothetical protein